MTGSSYQFLEGYLRCNHEMSFYIRLHPCPQCGTRRRAAELLNGVTVNVYIKILEDGSKHNAEQYQVTCSYCSHTRTLEFLVQEGAQERYRKFMRDVEIRNNYSSASTFVPAEVMWATFQLGAPPEPSTLIQAHEFAAELVRLEEVRPRDPTEISYADWRQAGDDSLDALTCVYELRKFFDGGADEISDAHFRTAAARAVRAAHPEWFSRSWLDEQEMHWDAVRVPRRAQSQRRQALPADDPRSYHHRPETRRPVLPPLSPASLLLHDKWLDDKGGERLQARGIDATGKQLTDLDLTAAIFEDVVFDRANFAFTRFHGAKFTGVRARGAALPSAMIAGTELTRCDFSGAALPIANLGDATIVDCDFAGADLERTTWYRSQVTRCTFAGATLTNCGLDHAVFTDCDFREADLGMVSQLLGTACDTVFLRCDLRGSHWHELDLFRAQFVDCKFAGVRGAPHLSQTVVERADLSPAGDGSQLGDLRAVCALWGIDLDAPPPAPTPLTHRELVYDLPDSEGDALEDELKRLGHRPTSRLHRVGLELWLEVRVVESLAAPIGPLVDEFLATHRAARANQTPLPALPATLRAARIREILNAGADRGTFESTVADLVAAGLTHEQALEAVIDPESAVGVDQK